MENNDNNYRSWCRGELRLLLERHRAAFAASCAERQFGTYIYASREDSRLEPATVRQALDRAWAYIAGEPIDVGELKQHKLQVERLIPDLDENFSRFGSLVLDATASVAYTLSACLTGSIDDAVFAGECAQAAVDEWVMNLVAPEEESTFGQIISITPNELNAMRSTIDAHPMMVQEMHKQRADLAYLLACALLDPSQCDRLRSSNGPKSNIGLD